VARLGQRRWLPWAFTFATVLLSGCGTAWRPPQSELAAATSTPPPEVKPAQATIQTQNSFEPFKNQYGDPLEAINVRISSNIPHPVRVQVSADFPCPPGESVCFLPEHEGDSYSKCLVVGCLVPPGDSALVDWFCDKVCPPGNYKLSLLVCSYTEDKMTSPCTKQEAEYLAWVGPLGSNLAGNPLAVADNEHKSILNLQRAVTFTHP